MDSSDRFLRRKQIRQDGQDRGGLFVVPDSQLVQEFLSESIDTDAIQEFESEFSKEYDFEFGVDVSPQEVTVLLGAIQAEFDDQKFDALISACKKDVLTAVVVPFGLGGLVSRGDKLGGNVDTIHNARLGTYATDEEREKYESRPEYNTDKYHQHKDYIERGAQEKRNLIKGKLDDSYTGDKITRHDDRSLDHTISSREIDDDPSRILADKNGADIANKKSNLNSTSRSINSSKQHKSVEEYIEYLKKTEPARKDRIKELSQKNELSDQERKEFKKLIALEKVDPDKLRNADKKAREEYEKTINEYYSSSKFITNVAFTGVQEGLKMGTQQACGVLVCEFFSATFDELQDIYKNGFASGIEAKGFFTVLKERLMRIADKIAGRWNDVTEAFSRGFISGFLSNLVTVVINMFVRTEKRIVRIIREGFFSLLQAIKMVCSPPKGMTAAQAAHEASKLIAAGLTVAGGIAVEYHIDTLLKAVPQIEPFADIITAVLVGGLTGLATTFVIYAIDKADFFKVNDKEQHRFAMQKLEADLEGLFAEGNALVESMG